MSKVAVIAGAGPAGLTAALEPLRRSDYRPLVFEADTQVGGISKTVEYNGNRMDLGGHRFFSKSDWVMDWWQEILPVQDSSEFEEAFQSREFAPRLGQPLHDGRVMLVRSRLSRIYYRRRFFDYPLKLNGRALGNLERVHSTTHQKSEDLFGAPTRHRNARPAAPSEFGVRVPGSEASSLTMQQLGLLGTATAAARADASTGTARNALDQTIL